MSALKVIDTAFPIMRRKVSPIPMGLTRGHLSMVISVHATRASRLTQVVQILLTRQEIARVTYWQSVRQTMCI